ncbi:HAD superfamily (HisB1/GmhB) (PDB:2GMW) (PUBMED:20050615 [Commensalibacter communis]|uniref:D,D-heptose 1,7-bisphosphate phosphatase n=1 Tax=Commensalibacter communis TaxID=2972786 RepID=A0A9W4TML7_9PROT|nr:HAD family hydrolase [Commensalibacter communis]CAI3949188.1 HAD superfamily (HisB1/GmhB) (PDB:2GMW) (PUBMED:20050615 [Commensalibacter communis]CAI3949194.1 HAD superfamily (HisB1/GmhB) (PDB:2GMW) (PUBMED:20050615 [Commensalibacter communis]CAI3949687.1 HAD superfamily (HisB1/GmhB) (PDB:2GMW) (PUBMED:20050615 [Commensalibacter communis]CAI3955583.1 HAD superfamily (HisB1/GmhB) (PDB:2GMW) (PUBMED:20050615 [Commensalibacter communis]CAI3957181.1 HAD superfamily (HisB1/GmhB) (PDB:2GMW) (PUBME
MNRCVFLDRDGVINMDTGYPCRQSDLQLIDGAGNAIARLNQQGFLVIIVTNQSGVARGYFTEQDVHQFHQYISQELKTYHAHIDAFYLCPYHPDGVIETYRQDHPDRKPNPGMIERACQEWSIDRERSFLIGDRDTDIEAAKNANIQGYLFSGGNLDHFVQKILQEF